MRGERRVTTHTSRPLSARRRRRRRRWRFSCYPPVAFVWFSSYETSRKTENLFFFL